VVFVVDDLAAWLVGLLADAGRKKLTRLVLGDAQDRALQQAAIAAVQDTADELSPSDRQRAGQIAMIIGEVFRAPVPDAPLAGVATLAEGLQAGIAGQLAVLDDAGLTGTWQSSAEVLGVPGAMLADRLTGHLVREIMFRGSRGGPLTPLADQLNHDLTHLQGQRLEGMLARLADEVRNVLTQPTDVVSLAAPLGRRDPDRPLRGRSALLDEIGEAWERGLAADRIQVLYGLGGCGKTSIALELVARVRRQAGEAIETWWVSAADSRQLRTGMTALAFRVGVTDEQVRHGEGADLLWQRLAARAGKWLLVIDNADDAAVLEAGSAPVKDGSGWLRPLDTGHGLVVVTSRDGRKATWGTMGRLRRVEVLDDGDAAQVLVDHAGTKAGSRQDAAALACRLGGLPLALRLAGSYLRESVNRPAAFADPDMAGTFAGYQALLERGQVAVAFPVRLAADTRDRQVSDEDARELIGRTWEISLDMLIRHGMTEARHLLRLLATFADAPIPYELLLRPGLMANSPLFTELTGSRLWECLQALEAFGFIDLLPAGDGEPAVSVLRLHPLVRDTSQSASGEDDRGDAYIGLAGTLAHAASPQGNEPENPDTWSQWEALTPHIAYLLGEITGHRGAAEDVASAANSAARFLGALGRYQESEQLFRQVLTVREQMLGDAQPDTLATRNEVAWMLGKQGRYEEAEEHYRKVLTARELVLGVAHPDTLATRTATAWMLAERGKFEEAEKQYRQVLEVSARVLGMTHPTTLAARSATAWMLAERGKFEEAEKQYRQILAVRERVLGEAHPDTLTTRNAVAWMLEEQNSYNDAEQLYRQVLAVRERVLGDAHPDTLVTQNAVARMLGEQNHYEEAEQLYRQVLEVSERVRGETHPDTLSTRYGIGRMLEEQGRYEESEQLYQQVLAIREQVWGPEHPHTLRTKSRLFHLQALQGKYSEAEHGLRATAAIQARVIGGSHPATLLSRHRIALMIFKQGRYEEAEPEATAVYSQRAQVLGPQHPQTLQTQDLQMEIRRRLRLTC
jgi:tetratricopeptide (TPR) repeat protein